ncbi:hypothetical protein [Nocardia africana]
MTATDPFVPPKLLADMITAAISHRRSFVVQHGDDSAGNPFVTFTAKWLPEGCDVSTDIKLTWHTRKTGAYRLFSSWAASHCERAHNVTGKQAMRLLTSETCSCAADAA